MYLLKDNKLVEVSLKEDYDITITAVKSLDVLLDENNSKSYTSAYIKDKIYQLNFVDDYKKGEYCYCFQVIQSPWKDDSGLGNGHGVFRSKGDAIKNMIDNGFTIYINDVEFTNI